MVKPPAPSSPPDGALTSRFVFGAAGWYEDGNAEAASIRRAFPLNDRE
jgi:hypothetical protein